MKLARITNVTTEGKLYRVYLGNNTFHRFKSSKEAAKFIADTNKFICTTQININQYLIDIYTRFRSFQYYLDSANGGNYKHELNNRIKENIRAVEDLYDRVVFLSSTENGNHYSFSMLLTCCTYLKDSYMSISQVYAARSLAAQQYECKNNIEAITTIEASLNRYGAATAAGMVFNVMESETLKKVI